MRTLTGQPCFRAIASTPRYAVTSPRMDMLEELKYQLSNSDEGTRPARDLVENPIAAAYLVVLALLGAGLAFLIYSDSKSGARRSMALSEQADAAEMLRQQGLEEQAAVLESDLVKQQEVDAPMPSKPRGLAADPYGDMESGNRFERRQGRNAKKAKKGKRGGKGRRA